MSSTEPNGLEYPNRRHLLYLWNVAQKAFRVLRLRAGSDAVGRFAVAVRLVDLEQEGSARGYCGLTVIATTPGCWSRRCAVIANISIRRPLAIPIGCRREERAISSNTAE
jgi:hypothetical protein